MPRPMSLAAGSKHGPYESVAPIGCGRGMGEVYRTRDSKLNQCSSRQSSTGTAGAGPRAHSANRRAGVYTIAIQKNGFLAYGRTM
jgi:hypothetical protein